MRQFPRLPMRTAHLSQLRFLPLAFSTFLGSLRSTSSVKFQSAGQMWVRLRLLEAHRYQSPLRLRAWANVLRSSVLNRKLAARLSPPRYAQLTQSAWWKVRRVRLWAPVRRGTQSSALVRRRAQLSAPVSRQARSSAPGFDPMRSSDPAHRPTQSSALECRRAQLSAPVSRQARSSVPEFNPMRSSGPAHRPTQSSVRALNRTSSWGLDQFRI